MIALLTVLDCQSYTSVIISVIALLTMVNPVGQCYTSVILSVIALLTMVDPWSLAVTFTGESPVSMADLWIWCCQSMVTHQWSSHPDGRPLQKVLECCEFSLLCSGSPPALTCSLHSSVFGRIQCRSPLAEILKRKEKNETAWLLSYSLLVAAHSSIPGLDCKIKVETETVSVTFKPLTDLVSWAILYL